MFNVFKSKTPRHITQSFNKLANVIQAQSYGCIEGKFYVLNNIEFDFSLAENKKIFTSNLLSFFDRLPENRGDWMKFMGKVDFEVKQQAQANPTQVVAYVNFTAIIKLDQLAKTALAYSNDKHLTQTTILVSEEVKRTVDLLTAPEKRGHELDNTVWDSIWLNFLPNFHKLVEQTMGTDKW